MCLTNEGKISHKKMWYNYRKKMLIRRAKPNRMIDDPDNQLPDNWSSTLY